MSEVSDIATNLKALMATELGVEYSELPHATVIEKNSFKNGSKKYGVLPKSLDEVAGTTCNITVDQNFDLILTDSYGGKSLNDADKQAKTIALQELAFSLYKEVTSTKAGTPSIVIKTGDLTVADPEYLEEDHIVVITATVTIKYRKQL